MSGRMNAFAVVLHCNAAPLTAEWIANVKKSNVDYVKLAI